MALLHRCEAGCFVACYGRVVLFACDVGWFGGHLRVHHHAWKSQSAWWTDNAVMLPMMMEPALVLLLYSCYSGSGVCRRRMRLSTQGNSTSACRLGVPSMVTA
jgi:hypothetical protein